MRVDNYSVATSVKKVINGKGLSLRKVSLI